ncbi:MAG: hypothetical protein K8E66_07390 [Phycisphaerales bacterium]|nr:hypothetical protein [Phycisphaerales bacterium]
MYHAYRVQGGKDSFPGAALLAQVEQLLNDRATVLEEPTAHESAPPGAVEGEPDRAPPAPERAPEQR